MQIDTLGATKYFKTNDPVMHQMLVQSLKARQPLRVPEPLPPEHYFGRIVTSIISQQISTKAAASIRARVEALVGELAPENILDVTPDALRASGLSGQKVKYITYNAAIWHEIPYKRFNEMSDEEVIAKLTELYGIGRWTAEMFLMFSLARPDVFSYGDLGLMQSLYEHYQFRPHYTRKIRNTVEGWSPHRTLAALTLWHHKDGGPLLL